MKILMYSIMAVLAALSLPAIKASSTELSIYLPLGRASYQDNEWIDITIARIGSRDVASGNPAMNLIGEDGSSMAFHFGPGTSADLGQRRFVEHLRLAGWLLRPGSYNIEIGWDGAFARTNITVHSHIRNSDFKVINWGRAKGAEQLAQGQDGLGFNLFYGESGLDSQEHFIRAGVDFMANCVMSGGHQMDLRNECDWSDPYVIRGGTRRAVRRAFMDRTNPNVWGVHFYDEPGLTWAKDPETGEMNPHTVPWQLRSYEAAYGEISPDWKKIDPTNSAQLGLWFKWARWKLGLMDAAWQDAQFGVQSVKPSYVSVTQSQYGYGAFCDGYYFNVARSLPVTSGHGGYHDFGPGYFNPSMFLEIARARDLSKPNWYLPTWYGSTTADAFRLEQYLSFQCGLQGMITPPELEMGANPEKVKAAEAIVESNHLMARLGPIFNNMVSERPPVAMLFSISQMIHAQAFDRKKNYAHETAHGRNLMFGYLAGKLLQHQFMPMLDEDVLDGTLSAHHKAILLISIDYLDSGVFAAIEKFAQEGGLVLLTADCQISIAGATRLDVAPGWPDGEKIAALNKAGQSKEAGELMRLRQALIGASKLAAAIRPLLEKCSILPPLESSEPGIVVTRQAEGDVEYLFAVNASHDDQGDPMLGVKTVKALLSLPDNGRPVYDAVHGVEDKSFKRSEQKLRGEFSFGPGQMRVFARTARRIGGVKVESPLIRRDYTKNEGPICLDIRAVLCDQNQSLLTGAFPCRIRVIDALGNIRYDLLRATDRGVLSLELPLAANDPDGEWKIEVAELLSGKSQIVRFIFPASKNCPAIAGAVWRAVYRPEDRSSIFRFFRQHHAITIVKGDNAFHQAAAERLQRIFKPWNVICTIIDAKEASKPRRLSDDEAKTWIGMHYAGQGQIKPGDSNSPAMVGFSVPGPVIVLGQPEDNPLIKFIVEHKFLPYKPQAESLPGRGRGYVSWQREAIGVNQESIVLIAYDQAGINEAVGTLYEIAAGQNPLTPLAQAQSGTIRPASKVQLQPGFVTQWSLVLDDRITGLKVNIDKLTVLTRAEILTELSNEGKVLSKNLIQPSNYAELAQAMHIRPDASALAQARKSALPHQLVKLVIQSADRTAVAYWGGAVSLFDNTGSLIATEHRPQDITAMTWMGGLLILGDADGRIAALTP